MTPDHDELSTWPVALISVVRNQTSSSMDASPSTGLLGDLYSRCQGVGSTVLLVCVGLLCWRWTCGCRLAQRMMRARNSGNLVDKPCTTTISEAMSPSTVQTPSVPPSGMDTAADPARFARARMLPNRRHAKVVAQSVGKRSQMHVAIQQAAEAEQDEEIERGAVEEIDLPVGTPVAAPAAEATRVEIDDALAEEEEMTPPSGWANTELVYRRASSPKGTPKIHAWVAS